LFNTNYAFLKSWCCTRYDTQFLVSLAIYSLPRFTAMKMVDSPF
jgi:hypothetical protein